MRAPMDEQFHAKLRALNDKFAASIPGTLGQLQAAREQFCAGSPDVANNLAQIHQILHTMAGSAATFGFAMLGQQARLLEQQLLPLMAQPGSPAQAWTAWLGSLDRWMCWAGVDPKASTYPGIEP